METKDIEEYLKDIFNGVTPKSKIIIHTGRSGKAMFNKSLNDTFELIKSDIENTIKEKELEHAREIIYRD